MELSDVTFDGGAFMLRLLCDKGGDTWPKALALSIISPLSPQGNLLYLSWLCRGRGSCSDGTVVSSLSFNLKVMSKNISFNLS